MEAELPKIINIDGVEYEVETLSPTVKRLLGIYKIWEKDANDARLSLAKTEAALRDLTREIQLSVKNDQAERENSKTSE